MKESDSKKKADGRKSSENKYITVDFWKFVLGFSLIILGTLGLISLLWYIQEPAPERGSSPTTSVATTSQPASTSTPAPPVN